MADGSRTVDASGSFEHPFLLGKQGEEKGVSPLSVWNTVWKEKEPQIVTYEGVQYKLSVNGDVNPLNV